MARTTSNRPSRPQARPAGRTGGKAARAVPPASSGRQDTAQTQAKSTDQYNTQKLHRVLRDMKAQVVKQTDRPFNPSRLVQSAATGRTGSPATVKTEELRAEMRQASQTAKASDMTEFEKVFLEFFSGSRTIAALLQSAEKKFRKKKMEEWREFYETFYAYTKPKKLQRDQVRTMIFRGLSEQDERPEEMAESKATPMLIADLHIKRSPRDRSEKFARFPVSDPELHNQLKTLPVGHSLATEQIDTLIGTGNMDYLSLYYRPVRRGLQSARGGALAQNLERQANAAARAREAMSNAAMGISSRSAHLAAEQIKKK